MTNIKDTHALNEKDQFFLSGFTGSSGGFIRLVFAFLLCGVTLTVGYTYAKTLYLDGWQFWLWLGCSCVCVSLLFQPRFRWNRKALILTLGLFLAALFVRILFIDMLPDYLHVDEYGVSQFARDNLLDSNHKYFNMFVTGPNSQPSLYHYIVRLCMTIWGYSIFGLRISSAIAGSLGVVAAYWMIRQISDAKTALFSGLMLVCYHFSVHYSRVGLNNIWDTLWVPLMVLGFHKAWCDNSRNGAVLCGAALGISQYFYHGSKIGFFILIFMLLVYWKQNHSTAKERIETLLVVGLVALCVAGPILMYMLKHPVGYFARASEVFGWTSEEMLVSIGEVNYLKYFWRQVTFSLGTYTMYPDANGFYGPGVALVFGPAALLFSAGIVISYAKRNWVPLAWLFFTTLFGGFMINVPNSSAHFVASIPAICWVTGYTLKWLHSERHERLAIALLITIMVVDIGFYFFYYSTLTYTDFVHPFPPL